MRFIPFVIAGSFVAGAAHAANSVYRDVDPDRLSGGLYATLASAGELGAAHLPPPARARASYPDLSKGRPPAVLDPRVGPNIRLGDDPDPLPATQRAQVEPHIVRSVANPDLLLATFQEGRFFDSGAISCGYAVSHDGGLTWRRALTPNLTVSGGRFNRATDPVAGAGPQGDLYLQALASAQGTFALAAVVVSRSTDGGNTWSSPAVVFESNTSTIGPDKNWLAVNDYAGSPNAGRLVSTWTQFLRNATGATISSPLVASVSDDRGATWSSPIEITPQGSSNQGTQPLFLPDGSLAVIYISFVDPTNVARFSIHCKRSLDGGRTFPGQASTVVPLVNGWDDPQLRDGVFLPNATVARDTGELFVTYTANVGGTPRVMFARSSDNGVTWSTPIPVSDQPAGISVMNPAIAATPNGRSLSIVFTDKRHAPEGRDFVDHYAALSFDGGATWQPNVRLSSMSSEIRFGPLTARGVMLGDYLAVAPSLADNQPCVAVWCETRTGDADPFTVRFTPAPEPSFEAWRVAHFSRSQLLDPGVSGTGEDTAVMFSHPNLIYYDAGISPLDTPPGEMLYLQRPAPDVLDVAWLSRPSSMVTSSIDFRPISAQSQRIPGGGALPPIAPPPGLVWRTERITSAPADLSAISRLAQLPTSRNGANVILRGSSRENASNATHSRLINIATRGRSGTGTSQMIVGFVIDGNKSMLVRAAGPALASLGVSGALVDPQLTLSAPASDLKHTNDNWQTGEATPALFTRVGAFPFATASLDAALIAQLGAQNYTAVVSAPANATGVTLIEAYDADAQPGAPGNPRLLNLSTRGDAGSGENALIAGFVLSAGAPRRVLLRAVGPTLATFNVAGTLADPVLTLYRNGEPIHRNDDWEISASSTALATTARRVGAFPLGAASLDSALLVTLAAGAYTAIVTSADGGTGLALIEIYDAD